MNVLILPAPFAKSPPYVPPPAVAACLSHAHIFAHGPSELAGLVGWLTGGDGTSSRRNTRAMQLQETRNTVDRNSLAAQRSLSCTTRFNLGDRHWQCPHKEYRHRGRCRETLYTAKPFEANCTGGTRAWRNASLRVQFSWKSYQYSRADEALHRAARRALSLPADTSTSTDFLPRRVIVVLSAGLAQFSRDPKHKESMLHNIRDDDDIPQPWMDEWMRDTNQLFRLFASLHRPEGRTSEEQHIARLMADDKPSPQRVAPGRAGCVVYRAQNIAARHTNASEPRHHPSSVRGPHHWLNRVGIALAKLHGISSIDLSDITQSIKASPYSVDGGRPNLARRADALEGDVYHGYPLSNLAPRFLGALTEACCRDQEASMAPGTQPP